MRNQNERLGQVKSELNQVIEQLNEVGSQMINSAIDEGDKIISAFLSKIIEKIEKEKAFPRARALPSKKQKYLYNEKIKREYRHPELKALFYDGDNEKKKDKVLEALGRGSCINAKQPPFYDSEVVAEWEQKGSSRMRDRRALRRRLKVWQSKPKPDSIKRILEILGGTPHSKKPDNEG